MSHIDARNVEQIRRDAERARANLTDTVQQLRETVSDTASDVRDRLSPESIKAGIGDYVASRAEGLVDAARRNPLQAAAVGALVGWPAMKMVRAIPAPILLIGAGLFLTGSKTGQDLSRRALDSASDLADDARRTAHDVAHTVTDRATDIANSLRRTAEDATSSVTDAVADVTNRASDAVADVKARVSGAMSNAAAKASGAASDIAAKAQNALPDGDRATSAAAEGAKALSGAADNALHTARAAVDEAKRRSASLPDAALAWAQANPLLAVGLGVVAGSFVASALPPTQAERSAAGAVSGAMRDVARQGVNAAVAVAAGAAVDLVSRAAQQGLNPDRIKSAGQDFGARAAKVADVAAGAALSETADKNHHGKSGE